MARYGERRVLRQVGLPGQRAHALKEFLKGCCGKPAHLQKHPVGAAKPEVGIKRPFLVRRKARAAFLCAHIGKAQLPQLLRHHAFQPEGRSCDIFVHGASSLLPADRRAGRPFDGTFSALFPAKRASLFFSPAE